MQLAHALCWVAVVLLTALPDAHGVRLEDLHRYETLDLKLKGDNGQPHALSLTHDGKALHPQSVSFELTAFDQSFTVDVVKNSQFIAERFVHVAMDVTGKVQPAEVPVEHCYYYGTVRGRPESSVTLSTCSSRSPGVTALHARVDVDGEVYVVEPQHHSTLSAEGPSLLSHIVYRKSDLKVKPRVVCGHSHDERDHSSLPAPTHADSSATAHDHDHDHDHSDHSHETAGSHAGSPADSMAADSVPHNVGHSSYNTLSTPTGPARHPASFLLQVEPHPALEADAARDSVAMVSKVPESSSASKFETEACEPSLTGFSPPSGCTCKSSWTYSSKTYCNSCGNPDGDTNGPWCFTSATCNGYNWAYCTGCSTDTTYNNYIPRNGCTCKSSWDYAGKTICGGVCALPEGGSGTPWCYTTALCGGSKYAYCDAPASSAATCTPPRSQWAGYVAPSGCQCQDSWTYNGVTTCGGQCETPDNDPNGAWCFTKASCNGQNWAYCTKPSAAPTCSSAVVNGVSPPAGCTCKSTWSYKGVSYCNGKCANPDNDPNGAWCYTTASCNGATWAYCASPSSGSSSSGGTASGNFGSGSGGSGAGALSGGTCPSSTSGNRVVELLIVADTALYNLQGVSLSSTQDFVLRIINGVNNNYQGLNMGVQVVLTGLITFTSGEPSSLSSPGGTIDNYLNRFTSWRATVNGKFDTNLNSCSGSTGCYDFRSDAAHLITGTDRSSTTTGLAWVGTMCGTSATGVDEATAGTPDAFVQDTVSHEMGHNFGCNHDSTGNSCPQSGYIMAAVGDISSANKPWSSCSKTTICSTLQSLESGSSCLANGARFFWGGCSCGDGIICGTEQCDLGADNGAAGKPCDASCNRISGTDCASGACCDTNTGKFRPSSYRCRTKANDCDVDDYCTGSSAGCSNRFLPDGNSCSSAGPGSQCYQGQCVGLDAQCAVAWSGYTGTWVAGGRSGITASCAIDSNGCGELMCTNTEWKDYCYSYNCPSGYTCTVGSTSLTGPVTRNFCNCQKAAGSTTTIYVKDGTPCGSGKICVNRQCINRPVTSAAMQTGCAANTCMGRGTCSIGDDGSVGCTCDDGYYGANCENEYKCDDGLCASRRRGKCRSDNFCGPCLPGFASNAQYFTASTSCDFAAPKVRTLTGTPAVAGTRLENLFDGDASTIFVCDFDKDGQALPYVRISLAEPTILSFYDFVSSNGPVTRDPYSWTLYGSDSGDNNRWVPIDEQTNRTFPGRNYRGRFYVKPSQAFSEYVIEFTDIGSVDLQGGSSVAPSVTTTSGSGVQNVNMSISILSGYSPRMELAEISLNAPYSAASSSSGLNVGMIVGVVIGCVAFVGLAVGGALLYRRHRRNSAHKAMRVPDTEMSTRDNALDEDMSPNFVFRGGAPLKTSALMPAPLPPGWTEHIDTASGHPYYYNAQSGTSSWVRPTA